MLAYLHMQNFALIDDLSLEFFPGMNVLTGETGAGKSMLIGAINLILGERASSEQVRTGAEQAIIEAIFTVSPDYEQLREILEESGLPWETELIILREISRTGRNICRVNRKIVPLSILKELGSALVDLHGQHSHQSLLRPEKHLFFLDEFGDEELLNVKYRYQEIFHRWRGMQKKLKSRGSSPEERKRKMELLAYQRDEILAASLCPEEEESLKQRLLLLDNMEKLHTMANRAYFEIYGGENALQAPVVDQISSIEKEMSSLLEIDPQLLPFVEILQEISTSLAELGRELYSYLDGLTFSPEENIEIENRLEIYRRLKGKYGATVEKVLSFAEKCAQKISVIENSEAEVLRWEAEEKALWQEIEQIAALLTSKRKKTAQKLELLVVEALRELSMENARFDIQFTERKTPGPEGQEELEFLFSANPGEPPKPLVRIISAGEAARVMLALKSILAEQDHIPTLVFDEIDSGIGGYTIQKVSEKLAGLSKKHQVICVTHSPQIASAADHQYYIYKEVAKGRAATSVCYLQGEKRILEIARLLNGGNMSEITKKHAAELLKKGQKL
ncbi:MAG: DNA repair protein RecN [Dethiobacteria bacterium]|jgi:DNA repair protein RecN (Recombination protein N)